MNKKSCLIVGLAILALCLGSMLCAGVAGFLWTPPRLPEPIQIDSTPDIVLSPARGTLRLAGSLPPTLDPALVQDNTSAEYVVHLYSGLVTLDADLEIVPDLAIRWDLLEDGQTYLFYLDEEAMFADSTLITADDVVYAFERACSPALASPVAMGYLGDIVGAEAYARGEADHIAGLEVLDPHTLRVTIDAPKAYFLAKLTHPVAFVVDRRQIEGQGDAWLLQPNGSGPFVLDELTMDRIVFSRNPRYHGQGPALESVEFLLSGGLPITMYENDEIDLVGVSANEMDRVLDPYHPLSDEVQVVSELSTEYLGLNANRPPMDDPLVRQALLKAVDRQKLAELVLNNTAVPARGILPPELAFDEDRRAEAIMAYDPEAARALLASSRYAEEMPEIVMTVSGTSGYLSPVSGAVVAMLEENLPLDIRVEQVAWGDFLQDLNEARYMLYSGGWIADYPDPQNFVDLLFHSASTQNHTGYANAEVDRLLELARVETEHEARMALYQEAELLILEDAPWIPLVHRVSYTLIKPWVQGYQASPSLYPWLKDISLSE